MICRDVLESGDISHFDFFNDFYDTHQWLLSLHLPRADDLAQRLAADNEAWLAARMSKWCRRCP